MIIINLYCTVPISAVSLCAVWYFKRYYTLHRNPYLLRLSFDRCLRLLRPSSRDLDLLLFLLIFLTDLSLSSLSLLSLLSLSLDIVTATAHWYCTGVYTGPSCTGPGQSQHRCCRLGLSFIDKLCNYFLLLFTSLTSIITVFENYSRCFHFIHPSHL